MYPRVLYVNSNEPMVLRDVVYRDRERRDDIVMHMAPAPFGDDPVHKEQSEAAEARYQTREHTQLAEVSESNIIG